MLEKGRVVKATAGRDKNRFFCIVGKQGDDLFLADGKYRPLEKPKCKNVKHVQATQTVLDLEAANTNKKLRALLRRFNNQADGQPPETEGGN